MVGMMGPGGGAKQVLNIPGVVDAMTLLQLVREPERYQKALEEIVAKQVELEGLVAKVGKAEDIERMHSEAKEQLEAVRDKIDKAERSAQSILSIAREQAGGIQNHAQDMQGRIEQERKEFEAWRLEETKVLHEREEALAGREKDAADKMAHASSKLQQAINLKHEFEGKLAKMKELSKAWA